LRATHAKLSAIFFQRYAGLDLQHDPEATQIWDRLQNTVVPALETPTDATGDAPEASAAEGAPGAPSLKTQILKAKRNTKIRGADLLASRAPAGRFLWLLDEGIVTFDASPLAPPEADGASEPGPPGKLAAFFHHDTLAIDLTLSMTLPGGNAGRIRALNPGGALLPTVVQPSLGQSLLLVVRAEPDAEMNHDAPLKALAQRIAQQSATHLVGPDLPPGKEIPPPRSTSYLLGGPLFEFEIELSDGPDSESTNPESNGSESVDADLPASVHLLVWVHLDEATTRAERDGTYYFPLLRLLVSRAKILYSYRQAHRVYDVGGRQALATLEDYYQKLADLPEPESDKLERLERILGALPSEVARQAQCLNEMKIQRATLETNRHNYAAATAELEDVATQVEATDGVSSDLSGLTAFTEEAQHLERQVETDLQFLQPGETLASHVLGSVQAQTDLLARQQHREQEQREREVEKRIKWIVAAIGAVLTVGSIMATVGEEAVQRLLNQQSITIESLQILWSVTVEALVQLGLGVVVTVIFAVPVASVWLGRWIARRLRSNPEA
jgi:hypothetical protein